MSTERPRYTVSVDQELFDKIEDYKFKMRYGTRSDATVDLIEKGLSALSSEASSTTKKFPVPAEPETGERDSNTQALLEAFHRLNKEGQDRLVEFSEMLLSKDKYKANSKIPGSSSGETVRVFVAARSTDNTPPKWVDMPKEEVDEIFNAPESDAEF